MKEFRKQIKPFMDAMIKWWEENKYLFPDDPECKQKGYLEKEIQAFGIAHKALPKTGYNNAEMKAYLEGIQSDIAAIFDEEIKSWRPGDGSACQKMNDLKRRICREGK